MNRRLRSDTGAATVWMIMGTLIVLAVCGLVFDGGLLISGTRKATNDAETAARAGAQALDVGAIYGDGTHRLNTAAAVNEANAFLARNGWTGTATADSQTVTVTITRTQRLTFLTMLGLGSRTITGTATARPARGLATH
jgi:Flp pilus assembly protein TadG